MFFWHPCVLKCQVLLPLHKTSALLRKHFHFAWLFPFYTFNNSMLFFFTVRLPRLKADPFLLGSGEVLPGIRTSSPKVRTKLLNVHLFRLWFFIDLSIDEQCRHLTYFVTRKASFPTQTPISLLRRNLLMVFPVNHR